MAEANNNQGGTSEVMDRGTAGSAGASSQTPPGSADAASAEGERSTAPAGSSPLQEDWRDRRIAKLTAQKRELEGRLASQPVAGMSPADVEARAQAIAEAKDFNERCDAAAEVGKQQWPDFPDRVKALAKLVDFGDQSSVRNYNMFITAALETGVAHELVYELGADLNEANRILSLPPIKMATTLAKMAGRKGTSASDISGSPVPKPLNPLATRGSGGAGVQIAPDDPAAADRLSTRAWMERRNKQLQERRSHR